ncbi:MAG: 30S ribosomal protein S2 [Enterobacteriaceae bacterium]
MNIPSIEKMIKSGVHFGHKTKFWNPKMKPFIFGKKNEIHIINLEKTCFYLKKALKKIKEIHDSNGRILFIGTKKAARYNIKKTAIKCNQFFINNRWLGGTLTNWKTIKNSIKNLNKLESQSKDGTFLKLTKKEVLIKNKELNKLKKNLDGIKKMNTLPNAIFVVDANFEKIAIKEAKKMNIIVFSIVDTNSNPDNIDYIIPGNDDSIKSIKLYLNTIESYIL